MNDLEFLDEQMRITGVHSYERAVSIERCSILRLIVAGASDPRFCLEFDCRLLTICEATNPSPFPIHGATVIPLEIISSVCS